MKADGVLPILWCDEQELCHSLQSCEEASGDNLPLWWLLRQVLQGAATSLQSHEDLLPVHHEQTGEGNEFSKRWKG